MLTFLNRELDIYYLVGFLDVSTFSKCLYVPPCFQVILIPFFVIAVYPLAPLSSGFVNKSGRTFWTISLQHNEGMILNCIESKQN